MYFQTLMLGGLRDQFERLNFFIYQSLIGAK